MRLHSSANFSFDMQKANPEFDQQIEDEERNAKHELLLQQDKSGENLCCRICLSEEEQPNHELITPCNCTGSVRFIGLSCLKEWLEGKRHCKETPYVNSYIWKNLECEICKAPFKDIFRGREGRELNLLNYVIHEGVENYMIIESVTQTTSKTIHVINFSARPSIKVGRAQVAEVRITDISVSRHHSNLTLCPDGSVALTDNFSKFGTLKLLRHPIAVPVNKTGIDETIYIQIGRSTVALSSFPRQTFWQKLNCCFTRKKLSRVQVENFLHFEEAFDQFPSEFCSFFGGRFLESSVRDSPSPRHLSHFRTRSGNHDASRTVQLTQEEQFRAQTIEDEDNNTQQVLQTQANHVSTEDRDMLLLRSMGARDTNIVLVNLNTEAREESKTAFEITGQTRLPEQSARVGMTGLNTTGSVSDFTQRLYQNRLHDVVATSGTEVNQRSTFDERARAVLLGTALRNSAEVNLLTQSEENFVVVEPAIGQPSEEVDPTEDIGLINRTQIASIGQASP